MWFAILVRLGTGNGGGKAVEEEDKEEGTVEVEEGERYGFAGSIAYLNAEPANASCEIGHVSFLLSFALLLILLCAVSRCFFVPCYTVTPGAGLSHA